MIKAHPLCALSFCSCPCLFRPPLYPHRDREKLLLRKWQHTSDTDEKRATGMCLTAARISNFNASVAECFLQAMEAHNSPPWMCTGGNMGRYSQQQQQQELRLTLVLLTNQPSTQIEPRQGEKKSL